MSYNSKYKGVEVERLLDSIGNKVDKVDGKQLSTEDFTTVLKQKLDDLSNYDDTDINQAVSKLRTDLDTLVSGDTTAAIKTFNEVIAFLDGISDTEELSGIIANIEQQIAAKYTKPSGGIPKSDLVQAVQTSLGKADSALQSHQSIYTLIFQSGTFASGSFTANSGNKTINIPTTTSHVSEGNNLYFTNERAVSALGDTLKSYVTLSGSQTVSGEKNFTGGLKVNGSPIVYDAAKKYWKLEGDLLITGGLTMYGSDSSFTPSTIMDAIFVDDTTISKEGGVLRVIGGGGISSITKQMVIDALGFTPVSSSDVPTALPNPHSLKFGSKLYDGSASKTILASDLGITWDDIFGRPTLLSSFTDDVVAGKYLPLSGGSVKSSSLSPLAIDRDSDAGAAVIGFTRKNVVLGFLGFNDTICPKWYDSAYKEYSLIHTGNYSSYALPLSGGTLISEGRETLVIRSSNSFGPVLDLQDSKGNIISEIGHIPSSASNYNYGAFWTNIESKIGFVLGTDGIAYVTTNPNTLSPKYAIWHEGNFTPANYLPLSGGTISGFFAVNGSNASYTQYKVNNTVKGEVGWHSNYGIFIKNETSKKFLNITDEGLAKFDGYTIIHSGNIGSQSVNYATSAGSSDSLVAQYVSNLDSANVNRLFTSGFQATNRPGANYATGLTLYNTNLKYTYQFALDTTGDAYIRYNNNSAWQSWREIAFTDSDITGNAATASALTELSNADDASSSGERRKIWMSYLDNKTGRPALSSNLTFQTSTNTLYATNFSGNLTGNVTGNCSGSSGSCTGNAASATNAEKLGGVSYQNILERHYSGTSRISSEGWYRIGRFSVQNGAGGNVTLKLNRHYNVTNNESYEIVISQCYDGIYSFTQTSGTYNSQHFTKIRVDYTNSMDAYIDLYYASSVSNTIYWTMIGSGLAYTEATPVSSLTGNGVEFNLGKGCISSLGFTGNLNGAATKLQTARTIWGQSFDGSADVNGMMYDHLGSEMLYSSGVWLRIGNGLAKKGYPTYIDGNIVYLRYGTGLNNGLTLDSSGNIGIGTTTPSEKLEVNGNISALRGIFGRVLVNKGYGDNVGDQTIETYREGLMLYLQYYHNGGINLCQGGGNVGIGTTKPSERLEVNGNVKVIGNINLGKHAIGYSLSEVWEDENGYTHPWYGIDYSRPTDYATFSNWYGIRLMVGANGGNVTIPNGNVGIGTNSPNKKLDVNGDIKLSGYLYSSKSGSDATVIDFQSNGAPLFGWGTAGIGLTSCLYGNHIEFRTSTSRTLNMTLTASGNLGIGTTSPSQKLHVDGNILTTGGVTMYSQKSLKNVVDEEGLTLEQLKTIKPTRYTWKDGRDNRIHFGGIADDIQQVLPEVVYNANGVLTMDYGNAGFAIASSLIKPVVDHEQRIKALEKENEELKQEIKRLRA